MTNKAKTYLKNIQEADTEKKLIGIEIAFKQDMTLSCNELGRLDDRGNRAAEKPLLQRLTGHRGSGAGR